MQPTVIYTIYQSELYRVHLDTFTNLIYAALVDNEDKRFEDTLETFV